MDKTDIICKCGHPWKDHILDDGQGAAPCQEKGCSCMYPEIIQDAAEMEKKDEP